MRLDSALSPHSEKKAGEAPETPHAIRKPRVLVVNVFFPPQAIGGATRVVTDQITYLSANYGQDFELGVLCGNDEDTPTYCLEAYSWNGIPVWSISTPERANMDWIYDDPGPAPFVKQVLEFFRPDLVHFHCIQRLTLSVVKEVEAFGAPFVVTVHDAWWISDHQFLIDGQCRLRMPWELEQHDTLANPHPRGASASRKLALRAVLGRANKVVSVSESLRELISAGWSNSDRRTTKWRFRTSGTSAGSACSGQNSAWAYRRRCASQRLLSAQKSSNRRLL